MARIEYCDVNSIKPKFFIHNLHGSVHQLRIPDASYVLGHDQERLHDRGKRVSRFGGICEVQRVYAFTIAMIAWSISSTFDTGVLHFSATRRGS